MHQCCTLEKVVAMNAEVVNQLLVTHNSKPQASHSSKTPMAQKRAIHMGSAAMQVCPTPPAPALWQRRRAQADAMPVLVAESALAHHLQPRRSSPRLQAKQVNVYPATTTPTGSPPRDLDDTIIDDIDDGLLAGRRTHARMCFRCTCPVGHVYGGLHEMIHRRCVLQ